MAVRRSTIRAKTAAAVYTHPNAKAVLHHIHHRYVFICHSNLNIIRREKLVISHIILFHPHKCGIYCQERGMEKYMKFPMYKKETKDKGYHDDPFRAVNFNVDSDGDLVCPGGKKFHFAYRKAVRGNQYGRQEETIPVSPCLGLFLPPVYTSDRIS